MFPGNDKKFFGADTTVPERIRGAWQGRISGCLLGKPVEVLSFKQGRGGLESFLREAGAFPLRDYVPLIEGTLAAGLGRACCRGHISRAEPDDDINYTVLALQLMEDHGPSLATADVARAWLRCLPVAWTFTAERAAFKTLLARALAELLPPMSRTEALEVTRVRSASGLPMPGAGVVRDRPFRAPHHTVSHAGL